MEKAEQFRQYAEEAMRWARQSTTEKEKLALLELARTWTQAAQQSESISAVKASPPEARPIEAAAAVDTASPPTGKDSRRRRQWSRRMSG